MSLVKSSLGNILTKIISYPLGFIASIIVAKILGPEDRGVYAFIILIPTFLIPVFSLGIGTGITYYISNKNYSPSNVFYTTFFLGLLLGIFNGSFVILLWSLNLFGEVGNKIKFQELLPIILSLPLGGIFFMLSKILYGDKKFHYMNTLELFQKIVSPLLLVGFVLGLAYKIEGASWALFLVSFLLTILILIYVIRKYSPKFTFNKGYVKDSFHYGIKGWPGDIAVRANVRLDQIILGLCTLPSELGNYAIAVTLSELLWIVTDSLGIVLFAKIASSNNIIEKMRITLIIHKILIYLTLTIGIFLIFAVNYLIIPYGYGMEYTDAFLPFMLLLPGTVIYISAKITTKLLSGSGMVHLTSKSTVLGSLVSIILYIILIPSYGIIGAAIASSIGYSAISILCIYYCQQHFDFKTNHLFNISYTDINWAYKKLLPFK